MFRPYPYEVDDESTRMHVLIKGRGTVIFDIPQGVTYQASSWDYSPRSESYESVLLLIGAAMSGFA